MRLKNKHEYMESLCSNLQSSFVDKVPFRCNLFYELPDMRCVSRLG